LAEERGALLKLGQKQLSSFEMASCASEHNHLFEFQWNVNSASALLGWQLAGEGEEDWPLFGEVKAFVLAH